MIKPSQRRLRHQERAVVDRLKPGEVLRERYRIVRLLGRGGMGEVYEAVDSKTEERVAAKTVLSRSLDNPKVIARFRRETELSQRASHPNVLKIHDVFELPVGVDDAAAGRSGGSALSTPVMVMEYLDGESLADRLEEGERVPPGEARGLVIQMAKALAAAHKAGVVHRDLKPDNIFLVPAAGGTRVVLTDFGVARPNLPEEEEEDSFTAADVIVGTPTYMAPEQLELEEALPASDIYTLGIVMYQMLTGAFPFEGETAIQVVFMRVQEGPIPPRRHIPELDDTWNTLILRCLERDPGKRISDAEEIVKILEGHSGDQAASDDGKNLAWWPL